jgi:hypothetical protein
MHPNSAKVQNTDIRQRLDYFSSNDPDYLLLKSHLLGNGFTFSQDTASYVTADDADGSPLVGIIYHEDSPGGTTTAYLVTLYPADLPPNAKASHTYATEFFWGVDRVVHLWASQGSLQAFVVNHSSVGGQ